MDTLIKTALVETNHALPEEERQIEQSVLAGIGSLFANFAGSQREAYDAMAAETPIADGVTLEAVDEAGVRGWWVRPAGAPTNRAILFLHGGAYLLGSALAYRGFASQLASRAGVAAFVPDYPLAPEYPFPAAYDAAVEAARWLKTQGVAEIALAGDSAGGALALAALSQIGTDAPAVAAVVVFSPWTDLALTGKSFTRPDTHDPIFQPQILATAATTYLDGADPRDGRASPLYVIP
ncbi:MAG: alpha/beta hydrolase fold domain-containing protein, partial [Devosia sp.]